MTKNYFNIPVDDEDTYIAVKAIAENNGFGKRGMGQQIKAWVAQTLAAPVCNHPKTPVEVQWMPTETNLLSGTQLVHQAWFCPTCNRVYRNVQASTSRANVVDPYGQPCRQKSKSRKRGKTNEAQDRSARR